MLPIGLAFKILDVEGHAVDAGITLKQFARIMASEKIEVLQAIQGDSANIIDSMSVPLIMGTGFDIGFLYRWDTGFSAGLTFDDIVTRGVVAGNLQGDDPNSYYVPFSMNLGLAYDLRLGRFWPEAPGILSRSGVALVADWRDMTNIFQQDDYSKRNAALDFSVGLQLSVTELFKLRMGMNEMLPAVGMGFDFGPIEIDAAYYGKELGLEPGQLSTSALDLTLAIRPGAKKREWPWTRRSLVGLFSGEKTETAETTEADPPLAW
jgi:hypothetical protein